jgi:HAD superfamily hydrolase (TIGR01549 family)
MFKAIIFDYNGVLINDLDVHEGAYIKVAKEFGLSLSREVFRKYFSASPEQKRVLFFGEIPDETWNRLFQVKTEYYFELAKERNLLFSEVREVLVSLSKKYLLGLVTNTPRIYFERIFPSDLSPLFREMIFSDEAMKPKPSPEPLLEMMRRMGITADQCCYVGDSISDVTMAKQAGVRIFVVTTGDGSREELQGAEPDGILNSLSELEEELQANLSVGRGPRSRR